MAPNNLKKILIPTLPHYFQTFALSTYIFVFMQQGPNGLQNTSCDVGLHFSKFREYSVQIEMIKSCVCLLENVGRIPLAVGIMTTANGMHPKFSGSHTQPSLFPIFNDLYRLLTEITEVHYTPVTLRRVYIMLITRLLIGITVKLPITYNEGFIKKLNDTYYFSIPSLLISFYL